MMSGKRRRLNGLQGSHVAPSHLEVAVLERHHSASRQGMLTVKCRKVEQDGIRSRQVTPRSRS
jgi:hypothetical protein